MTDMSDTFKDRLNAGRAPLMVHVNGPKKGQVHPKGPYCERAGCRDYVFVAQGYIPADAGDDARWYGANTDEEDA